jgi:hypothetical protein
MFSSGNAVEGRGGKGALEGVLLMLMGVLDAGVAVEEGILTGDVMSIGVIA